MNLRKRQIRAARKAKAQRLERWQHVPTPQSKWAVDRSYSPGGADLHSRHLKRLSGGQRRLAGERP